jgi:hypothetical protein
VNPRTVRAVPPRAGRPLDFPVGINVVDVREAERLARHLIHTVVELAGRDRVG